MKRKIKPKTINQKCITPDEFPQNSLRFALSNNHVHHVFQSIVSNQFRFVSNIWLRKKTFLSKIHHEFADLFTHKMCVNGKWI